MKSAHLKKIALAVLLAIAVYIWWGNLGLFFPEEHQYATGVNPTAAEPTKDAPKVGLVCRDVKVNPFWRPTEESEQKARRPTPEAPAPPPPLRSMAELAGILDRGKASQAVLVLQDGSSIVAALGDTVSGWVLTGVRDSVVIFVQGKFCDTLSLSIHSDTH